MAMSSYEQDIWGPWTVSIWRKCLLLKKELLDYKYDLTALIIQSVCWNCSCLVSRVFFTAGRPDWLSILGNMLTVAELTNIQSSVKILLFFNNQ